MPGCCCEMTDRTFGEKDARGDLRDYRAHGPQGQTRELLRAVRSLGLSDATLLDIGGGVGVIHHELLQDVAVIATHVDESSAYLKVAREEAGNLGHEGRVTFIHADFTDVARDLPVADIVTLDRVVCCYPNFQALLTDASAHARRALGLVYPRDIWYVRAVISLINLLQRLRKDPFRVFVHPIPRMEAVLTAAGLRRLSLSRFLAWEVALYQRDGRS